MLTKRVSETAISESVVRGDHAPSFLLAGSEK
jgi:hypothetical protein